MLRKVKLNPGSPLRGVVQVHGLQIITTNAKDAIDLSVHDLVPLEPILPVSNRKRVDVLEREVNIKVTLNGLEDFQMVINVVPAKELETGQVLPWVLEAN